MTYKQLDRKASYIVTKLRDHVLYNGYHENLGQDEQRKYNDLVNSQDELSHAEKHQLKDMLRVAIESI